MAVKPDFENQKWIERHRHMFNKADVDKTGSISLDQIICESIETCRKLGATPKQTVRFIDTVRGFFQGMGLQVGRDIDFDSLIKGLKQHSIKELERMGKNQITLIQLWIDALFDIIDKDGNGSVDFEEWKSYTQATGLFKNDEDCRHTFTVCDLDNNGKITIEEMTRHNIGFWYSCDPRSDGLFGKTAVP